MAGDLTDDGGPAPGPGGTIGQTPSGLAAALRADLRRRWAVGDRAPAEEYLTRHPAVGSDAEAAVDLIFAEYLVREGLGEAPDPDEYARRFPQHAAVLRDQLALHRAMATGPAPTRDFARTGGPTVTRAPTGNAPTADDPAGAVGRAALPDTAGDLRGLLRKRLLFLSLMMSGVFAASVFLVAVADLPLDGWAYLPLGVFGLGVAAAGLLLARRSLSVRQLRAVELVIFGALYAKWSLVHASLYQRIELPEPPVWFGFVLGYAVSLPWTFLIVFYGVLVPNTGRRCAAVVGVMAVTPLVISATTGLAARATAGHSPANYFVIVAVSMASAAAIAIHSSHRIEVLRRAAAEARQLGPYRLVRKLGAGGMGEVHLAEHRLLKRPCAVKLIRPDQAADDTSVRRFEREVDAATRLTHPAAVQVYDYGRADDGTFYYVMEYLPGLTLDQVVARSGPLPPGRAVHVLRQVCGALAEAHALGLVHRDVKPSNVMLCRLGGRADAAKLLDFGLVSAAGPADDRLTRTGGIMGTPAYMSPEQAKGADAGPAADVYALGALGYFLLTGRPPFGGKNPLEVLHAHLTEAVVPPGEVNPAVPADLGAVVMRCLAKDPPGRFATAAELDAALAGCRCAAEWTGTDAAAWWAHALAGE